MPQLESVANANLSFSAALQKFESLTLAEQLPILAFVLRYEVGRIGVAKSPARARREPAAPATRDLPPAETPDSKAALSPQPESPQSAGNKSPQDGANELRELAAAVKFEILEEAVLGPLAENQSSARAAARAPVFRAANRPASNAQNLSIATTIIVSFALTLGIMLWQRKTERPAARGSDIWATARAAAPTTAGPAMQPFRIADRPPSVQPVDASPEPRDVPPSMPATPAAPPLPVDATFRRIPRGQGKVEGGLANMSSEPLEVTALVHGRESGTQAPFQLSIAAGSAQVIGVDDGLELRSGDEVTLQSANYRDLVIQTP